MIILALEAEVAAAEAARVVSEILANPQQEQRHERARHAMECARIAAATARGVADTVPTIETKAAANSAELSEIMARNLSFGPRSC